MIFNSKQLEELENAHDASGIFEDSDEDSSSDEVGEAAMEWRRQLIEEAVENVKRAKTRPLDPSITYEIASLLFDRESRRFARVQRSVPGHLKIVYLNGGDREYGLLDVTGFLKEFGAQKRLSELSRQLGMAEDDVAIRLDALDIQPVEELEEEVTEAAEAPVVEVPVPVPTPKASAKIKKKVEVVEAEEVDDDDGEDDEDDDDDDDSETVVAADDDGEETTSAKSGSKKSKAAPKASPAPKAAAAKPAKKAEKSAKAAKPAKPSGGDVSSGNVNPIDDPNGFIKANYQEQSNREMARITGLSEHTIRRKLGEWGLKRKK